MTSDPAPMLLAGVETMRSARSVAVLTGAGISTESGIPDFRGPNGVWTRDPASERRSNIHEYLNDPELRRHAWRVRVESEMFVAEPNAGHRALVTLAEQGRLHTLVTQNIDGLHREAGTPAESLVEIHGSVHQWVCVGCEARGPMEEALDRVRAGEADPPCHHCGGILKSTTVMFGESLVSADLERALRAAVEADVLLAVGTSLTVWPIAEMVPQAIQAGTTVVIVNAEPTSLDDRADVVIRGLASEVLPVLVGP